MWGVGRGQCGEWEEARPTKEYEETNLQSQH